MKREYTHVGFGTANGIYEGKETTFVVEFLAAPPTSFGVGAPTESVGAAIPSVTTSSQVLGSETVAPAALAASAAPAQPNWFTRLLASPLHTLMAIFTILFAVIATAFTIAVLFRVRVQHPRVLIGGTLLLTLIGTSMLLSTELAGSVQLTPATYTAAVIDTVVPN